MHPSLKIEEIDCVEDEQKNREEDQATDHGQEFRHEGVEASLEERQALIEPLRQADAARALAQHFRVSGYPTTIFLGPGGEHIASVPGYVPPERFRLMLRYIGEAHIRRGVSWQEFEKSAAAGPIRP